MDVFATRRDGLLRTLLRGGQLGVAVAGLGGMALAAGGGLGPQATPPPTPAPVVTASPSPTPAPTPSPAPSPVNVIGSPEVAEAQRLLNAQGFLAGPEDGQAGAATRHAVMAFQKLHGLERTGTLTPQVLAALRSASRPAPRFGTGRHVEIDLSRQVLFYVDGGVRHVVSISSGSGKAFTSQGWTRRAVTPTGRFRVTRKISGWRISPLGKLYYPSYFVGGVAVHGAPSVPGYPASHGCVRVPMHVAQLLYGLMPVGTPVIVHRDGAVPQQRDIASPPGQDTPDASKPSTPETPAPTPAATPSPTPPPVDMPTPRPPATPEPPRTPEPDPSPSP